MNSAKSQMLFKVIKRVVSSEKTGSRRHVAGPILILDISILKCFGVPVAKGRIALATMAEALRAGPTSLEGLIAGIGPRCAHELISPRAILTVAKDDGL